MTANTNLSWDAVARSVDSGDLHLDPHTASKCAQHCRDLVVRLHDIQKLVTFLSKLDGLGTFPSGIALAKKFSEKASGGAYSMDQALADHIAEVQQMQTVFEKIDLMYQAADDSVAQQITSAGSGY